MSKLFLGKLKHGDQLEQNRFRIDSTDESTINCFLNGMSIGDYVLAKRTKVIEKLLKFEEIKKGEKFTDAIFSEVKLFRPPLSLVADVVCCKYAQPDINLLNKAIKSTKGIGFIPIELEPGSPDIEDIDFARAKRRYFVCLKSKLDNKSLFNPSDICLVLDNLDSGTIIDIVEFTGLAFVRKDSFWNYYLKRTSKKRLTLHKLIDHVGIDNSSAPKKLKYLKAVLKALEEDGIYVVDNPTSMYDNIIVIRGHGKVKDIGPGSQSPGDNDDEEDAEDDERNDDYDEYAKLLNFNPNIILYGPPGTGKTYGAQQIVEAFENLNGRQLSFKNVVDEERAHFTTFHQAYSYEDFIEGIRPQLTEDTSDPDDEKGESDNGDLEYKLVDGVLKRIAKKCEIQNSKKITDHELPDTSDSSSVWKVSLGTKDETDVYTALRDKHVIAVGYDIKTDLSMLNEQELNALRVPRALKALYGRMNIGDLVLIFNDSRTVRGLGVITGEYEYQKNGPKGYCHQRKVEWLGNFEAAPKNVYSLNQGTLMVQSAVYKLRMSIADALSLLDSHAPIDSDVLPFYLIIDEINRGNIAKIFGELITLVEKDKRENISCTLPYSHKTFTLPKNLYLIGTMNTTDRNIALMDTALRRRFTFIEVTPDATIIKEKTPKIGHVSPADLLEELNLRITKVIGRDHRIGHSYFLGDDPMSKEDLFNIWYYNIMPLLMEYFYNDTKNMIKIVGDRFFDAQTGEIVRLGLKPNESGVSEFETALMAIYQKDEK